MSGDLPCSNSSLSGANTTPGYFVSRRDKHDSSVAASGAHGEVRRAAAQQQLVERREQRAGRRGQRDAGLRKRERGRRWQARKRRWHRRTQRVQQQPQLSFLPVQGRPTV